jgi:hypothetical protein
LKQLPGVVVVIRVLLEAVEVVRASVESVSSEFSTEAVDVGP